MVAAAVCMAVGTVSAHAGMDAKQVQIVAKVFSFLEKKPAAGATVVVLPGSADPAAVKAALGSLKISEGSPSDAAGAFAVFVGSAQEALAAKAANASTITIGSEVGCVDSGACVLVIETVPKVSIYVSRAAAQKAGVDFDTSFKMLMTER